MRGRDERGRGKVKREKESVIHLARIVLQPDTESLSRGGLEREGRVGGQLQQQWTQLLRQSVPQTLPQAEPRTHREGRRREKKEKV